MRCFKSGLHCTRLYIAFKAQKLLEVSEVFCSFTCIFKSKLLCTQSHLTKKRRAKYQTEMLLRIAKQLFRYKKCFQRNNTLTVDTNDQKFNCYNAKGHSQTRNRIKCWQMEFERQTVRTKATRSALRLCLHTVDRTFIYTNFLLLWI